MKLLQPTTFQSQLNDDHTQKMMNSLVNWFEEKGIASIKEDWLIKTWNHSFVELMKEQQVLATLMTPQSYGEGANWNTLRNVEFAELVGFYGITYWYTFQVSMLGLGPIFNGDNELVKKKAAQLLKEGKVFAFGLSEKEHGADIYSSEMELIPQADGTYIARGSKYYIGNGNEAALVSTFGKNAVTGEYVFFVVDSKHPNYTCVKNVVNQQNYVAEFKLTDYPITEDDILSVGQKAWDDMLNTINYCKFNLGFGSLGLATHAFYEALNHAASRELYGKHVTDFPQVKRLFTDAYCRMMGMKLFSYRATDYLRSASAEDRRYLLFNPMVKMKVTMQGEMVVKGISDIIAAKGFEKDQFFEIATNEIAQMPKLEGTAHVNMALIVKFMKNYFFNNKEYMEVPCRDDNCDDTFLFNQGPTKGLGKVAFHDYHLAYDSFDLPNINVFKQQIELFKTMLITAGPDEKQVRDIDYMLGMGELFTLVAYGQLILEKAKIEDIAPELLNQMFDVYIRDFSIYAVSLHGKSSNSEQQREQLLELIKAPVTDEEQYTNVWLNQVYSLNGVYNTK